MIHLRYDDGFDPPAPVFPLRVSLGDPHGWLQLAGLVDTGADITVLPGDVAERHLPVAGTVGIRGVTGEVEEAVLYRAEFHVGNTLRSLVVAGFGRETIVGRDLLSHLIVTLDGPAREMTISE